MPMCRVYGRRGTSATRPPAKSPRPAFSPKAHRWYETRP
jgi:hypothetical protein